MYLDPGFGGMLLQIIIAIAAVGGGILFALRRKIKMAFSKNKNAAPPANTSKLQDTPDDAIDVLDDSPPASPDSWSIDKQDDNNR